MIGALVVSGVPTLVILVASRRVTARAVVADERDLAILTRAPRIQGVAMLVCNGLWAAGLMVAYRVPGQVPVPFLVLMFWSCLLVYALTLPVGILLGYRRR